MSHALKAGLDVKVYSNLVHVTDEMWELFQSPRVSLALFASDARAHNAVTRRTSHKANRREADPAAVDAFAAATVRMYQRFQQLDPEPWRKAMTAAAFGWAEHRGQT